LERSRQPREHPGPVARDARSHEHENFVNQTGIEECGGERRPALEEQRLDPLARELLEFLWERPRAELELGAVGKRPLSEGASARGLPPRTVPIRTATASDCARMPCTSRRESAPVTHRVPGTRTRPSRLTATL